MRTSTPKQFDLFLENLAIESEKCSHQDIAHLVKATGCPYLAQIFEENDISPRKKVTKTSEHLPSTSEPQFPTASDCGHESNH